MQHGFYLLMKDPALEEYGEGEEEKEEKEKEVKEEEGGEEEVEFDETLGEFLDVTTNADYRCRSKLRCSSQSPPKGLSRLCYVCWKSQNHPHQPTKNPK